MLIERVMQILLFQSFGCRPLLFERYLRWLTPVKICTRFVVCLFSTVFASSFFSVIAQAASISSTTPLSFGTIIVESDNITVEIDAIGGVASPRIGSGGLGHVNGGSSGLVTVNSDTPGQFIILTYPNSILLSSGGSNMVLDGITSRSQQNATSSSAGDIDFHIGGLLHVSGGLAGSSYSGNMTVDVNVINP